MSEPRTSGTNLDVHYYTDAGVVYANNQVTFGLRAGERLGLVGESGSGKSTMALALMRMIKPPGGIDGGEMILDGMDLTGCPRKRCARCAASEIGMIPQGAMNSLNPVMRVRDQIMDGIMDHGLGLTKAELRERPMRRWKPWSWIASVGDMYPHELSGGMKQRVCIAVGIAMQPKVIIADEPTSALDVVMQRQVMQTLGRLQEELGSAVILIGHDMGLMAQFLDRLAVMYAGKLMEVGDVQDIFSEPLHPYTQMLIDSLPVLGNKGVFTGIPGITPFCSTCRPGCVFHTRCPQAFDPVPEDMPELRERAPRPLGGLPCVHA